MDLNYIGLIALLVALLLVMIQRTESKRRRLAVILVVPGLLLIRQNAFLKGDLHEETLLAFIIGIILSLLFWLLIGRYNPVGSDSEVKVIGMDD
jgi:predicted neutral ceramidase superfamily lipid hydrolase